MSSHDIAPQRSQRDKFSSGMTTLYKSVVALLYLPDEHEYLTLKLTDPAWPATMGLQERWAAKGTMVEKLKTVDENKKKMCFRGKVIAVGEKDEIERLQTIVEEEIANRSVLSDSFVNKRAHEELAIRRNAEYATYSGASPPRPSQVSPPRKKHERSKSLGPTVPCQASTPVQADVYENAAVSNTPKTPETASQRPTCNCSCEQANLLEMAEIKQQLKILSKTTKKLVEQLVKLEASSPASEADFNVDPSTKPPIISQRTGKNLLFLPLKGGVTKYHLKVAREIYSPDEIENKDIYWLQGSKRELMDEERRTTMKIAVTTHFSMTQYLRGVESVKDMQRGSRKTKESGKKQRQSNSTNGKDSTSAEDNSKIGVSADENGEEGDINID